MGIQNERQDDPPPYSPKWSSALDGDSDTMDNDAAKQEIEPLRRFLAYVLGDDYKTFTFKSPPAKEWVRFRRLSRVARKLLEEEKEGFYDKHEAFEIADLYYYVTEPAKALDLPVDVVHEMLISYPFDLTPLFGAYGRRFRRGFGDLKVLAMKLLIDREILIDAVVDCSRRGEALKRANKAIEEQWFTSLTSPDDYTLTGRGLKLERRLHNRMDRADATVPPRYCYIRLSSEFERMFFQ